MSDKQPSGKGKSRADEPSKSSVDESSASPQQQGNASSFGNKLLASATGLARDLVGSGNGALTTSLSDSASSSQKVRASTGNQSHGSVSNALEILGGSSSSSTSGTRARRQDDNFRTGDIDAMAAEAFEEFQQHKNPIVEEEAAAAAIMTEHDNAEPWIAEFRHQESNDVKIYSQDDGLEVTQLLADPYFVVMTDDVAPPEPDQSGEDAADLFTENFSAEEQQAAQAIKDDLPAAPIHQPIAADNPRNLVANFEAMLAGNDFNNGDSEAYAMSNAVHFHSKEDQQQWYSQWSGVLNQYTDEVWGDMLPIVREEKKHAEAIKEGKEHVDSKSVQRLNMILGHVEQYRHWRG